MNEIERFKELVENSDNIVFFGGAGVSTESGIPDFRSVDGLYNQKYDYPPETILSHSFYLYHTEEFYRFYRDKMLALDSDGSHNPEAIPAIYKKFVEGYDVVIGSRYVKGGQTADAKSSQIMSWMLNTAYRVCLGISAKDISTNFRMYHTDQLKQINLTCVNYDVLEEILLKIKLLVGKKNFRIGETPISFNKRLYGESKRQLIPFIISYIKTLFRLLGMRIRG